MLPSSSVTTASMSASQANRKAVAMELTIGWSRLSSQNTLTRPALDDFVASYRVGDITRREATERFKRFTYDELIARDKAGLDIFWLRDESLEDTANLPAPEVIAAEIVEDLRAALEEFEALAESLAARGVDIAYDNS